jgi:hypothetical protein
MEEKMHVLLKGPRGGQTIEDAVSFMTTSHDDFGPAPMEDLVSRLLTGQSLESLVERLIGLPVEQFDAALGQLADVDRAFKIATKKRIRRTELELIAKDEAEEDDFAGAREQLQEEIKAQAMETEYGMDPDDH